MDDDLAASLLSSIAADRLVILTGAGLSIPAPSAVPSAAALANQCAAKYQKETGQDLPADVTGQLEATARFFLNRGQLESVFIGKLIDWAPFRRRPNPAHFAIADFLACGVIDYSLTTNVDVLVEVAAERLGESDFCAALDGEEANVARQHKTLLKLHGCCVRDPRLTLWCAEQVSDPAWQRRLQLSQDWLAGRLMSRDVVLVGYWSDWGYLNHALIQCLGTNQPRLVVLVDPSPADELQAKAPELWLWANRAGVIFQHERTSGTDFLGELRARFSRGFLRRVCLGAKTAYESQAGCTYPGEPDLPGLSMDELYSLRRDFVGVTPVEVVRRKAPDSAFESLGCFVLSLVAAGAVLDGAMFVVGGRRIKVVHCAGRLLNQVVGRFAADLPAGLAPDLMVCVGAEEDGGVPHDLVRGGARTSIVRPGISCEWVTHVRARRELGLS